MLLGPVARCWPLHIETVLMTSGQSHEATWWPLKLCNALKCYLGKKILCRVMLVQKASRVYSHYLILSFIMGLHRAGVKYYCPFRRRWGQSDLQEMLFTATVFFNSSGAVSHLPD